MLKRNRFYLLAGAGLLTATAPAHAAENAMKVCGAKYQAAKSAHTLPAGQTWSQFLAQCRGTTRAPAATTHPAVAPAAAASPGIFSRMMGKLTGPAPAARPARASSGGGAAAMHERERQCGQQWKVEKAAGKIPAGQTWPRYWSQCNTRLKG